MQKDKTMKRKEEDTVDFFIPTFPEKEKKKKKKKRGINIPQLNSKRKRAFQPINAGTINRRNKDGEKKKMPHLLSSGGGGGAKKKSSDTISPREGKEEKEKRNID